MLVTVFTAAGGDGDAHALAHGVASALTGSVVFIGLALLVVIAVIARPDRAREGAPAPA